jgi:hypothetical protein
MRRRTFAWVHLASGKIVQLPIFDVSANGLRVAIGDQFISPNIHVRLIPTEDPRPARVIWCRWGMAGIEFK